MEYVIGIGLAAAVCSFARLVGFDRDRVFYPTAVAVLATHYILFVPMGDSTPALASEFWIAALFFRARSDRFQEEPLAWLWPGSRHAAVSPGV